MWVFELPEGPASKPHEQGDQNNYDYGNIEIREHYPWQKDIQQGVDGQVGGAAERSVEVYKIMPNNLQNGKLLPAMVVACGEQGIARTAELHIPMAARFAVECQCIVFSINCRTAPEFKCPEP